MIGFGLVGADEDVRVQRVPRGVLEGFFREEFFFGNGMKGALGVTAAIFWFLRLAASFFDFFALDLRTFSR